MIESRNFETDTVGLGVRGNQEDYVDAAKVAPGIVVTPYSAPKGMNVPTTEPGPRETGRENAITVPTEYAREWKSWQGITVNLIHHWDATFYRRTRNFGGITFFPITRTVSTSTTFGTYHGVLHIFLRPLRKVRLTNMRRTTATRGARIAISDGLPE